MQSDGNFFREAFNLKESKWINEDLVVKMKRIWLILAVMSGSETDTDT